MRNAPDHPTKVSRTSRMRETDPSPGIGLVPLLAKESQRMSATAATHPSPARNVVRVP
jgi:hypothetical protein